MPRKKNKKVAYRKPTQNRFSKLLITVAVLLLVLVAAVGGKRIQDKLEIKRAEYAQNEKAIDNELKRAEEIELLGKRSQTKEYYEEQAKEKLGLVYPNEIIFKAE